MKYFYLCWIFLISLSLPALAQTMPEATLSIQGIGYSLIPTGKSESQILISQADGLGISPNPGGDVRYDAERGGAYYSLGIEITSTVQGSSAVNGRLSVQRSPALSGNELPLDAVYDSDFSVNFTPGANINLLTENQPFIIRSDLPAVSTVTQRRIGLFIGNDLAPGRYQATVVYSFFVQ